MAAPVSPIFARMSSGGVTMTILLGSGPRTLTGSVSTRPPSSVVMTHLYCWPMRALVTGTVMVSVLQPSKPEGFHTSVFTALKYH